MMHVLGLFILFYSSFSYTQELGLNLETLNVNPKARRVYTIEQSQLDEKEDHYYLETSFGKLTQQQFSQIQERFGNFSQVPYSSEREYFLLDFLHPAMQAVANQTFEPIYYDDDIPAEIVNEDMILFSLTKNGIGSFSNCWNTTIEIVRMMNQNLRINDYLYQIHWLGRWSADELFDDELYIQDTVQRDEVRYGDVMTIELKNFRDPENGMIQHTAIVLSKGLVFEKTDTSENDAYRISYLDDVLKKYERLLGEDLIVKYKRLNKQTKTEIPYVEHENYEKSIQDVIIKYFPEVGSKTLSAGCEDRLGGGCDLIHTVLEEAKIQIYERTGRGIFNAPRKLLNRFGGLTPVSDSPQ